MRKTNYLRRFFIDTLLRNVIEVMKEFDLHFNASFQNASVCQSMFH